MKLLVLAQTPPPLHGQSVMVQAMVSGLPALGIQVHHVNLRLSRDGGDVGRWRLGKTIATVRFAFRAVAAQYRQGCDTLYYVPAPPAKRGALYRDWVLMALCRPFFRRLVLHWHAAGLGEWLQTSATAFERYVTRRLLGRADLAIVVADALRPDATLLDAKHVAIVPNGIPDPGVLAAAPPEGPIQLLFLGLCSEEKGLFAAAEAVLEANRHARAPRAKPSFILTAAGSFDGFSSASRFSDLREQHPECLHHAGVVGTDEKRRLFEAVHALCLPTRYAAEAMPLVALEALAHDRTIVATRWRALSEIVTPDTGILVAPGNRAELVEALLKLRRGRPAAGVCRARYLELYTLDRHLNRLAAALRDSATPPPARG